MKKSRKNTNNMVSGMESSKEFRIGFLVHDVSRLRKTLFDLEMKPYGITDSQYWTLAEISRQKKLHNNEDIFQSDLSRQLDVGKSTICGLIDRLESSGFVMREADRNDRRSKRIVITKKGYEILDKMAVVGTNLNHATYKGISKKDMETTMAVLERMKAGVLQELMQKTGSSDSRNTGF